MTEAELIVARCTTATDPTTTDPTTATGPPEFLAGERFSDRAWVRS